MFLETQLKEAKYISEDADRKYDEVNGWLIETNKEEYCISQYNKRTECEPSQMVAAEKRY